MAAHTNLTTAAPGLLSYVPFLPGALARAVVGQRVARQRLLERPGDHRMAYRSVDLRASDGVRLSAWVIPAERLQPLRCPP